MAISLLVPISFAAARVVEVGGPPDRTDDQIDRCIDSVRSLLMLQNSDFCNLVYHVRNHCKNIIVVMLLSFVTVLIMIDIVINTIRSG